MFENVKNIFHDKERSHICSICKICLYAEFFCQITECFFSLQGETEGDFNPVFGSSGFSRGLHGLPLSLVFSSALSAVKVEADRGTLTADAE